MRMLKGLVAFMGIMILLGLGLLAYGLYDTAGRMDQTPAPGDAPAPEAPAAFGILSLDQPPGSRIVSYRAQGPRLYLELEGGGLGPRIVVADVETGRVLGVITLRQDPETEAETGPGGGR